MINKSCSPGLISDEEHSLKEIKLIFVCKMTLKTQILQSLRFLKRYENFLFVWMIILKFKSETDSNLQ